MRRYVSNAVVDSHAERGVAIYISTYTPAAELRINYVNVYVTLGGFTMTIIRQYGNTCIIYRCS